MTILFGGLVLSSLVIMLLACRMLYILKKSYGKLIEQAYYNNLMSESNENLLLHIGEMSNIDMVVLGFYINQIKNQAIHEEQYELADKITELQKNTQIVLDSYAKNFSEDRQTEEEKDK